MKTRLANLLAAYKALEKEKKTLEESLAAIVPVDERDEGNVNDEQNDEHESDAESSERNGSGEGQDESGKGKEDVRLARLTASLAAMSQERATMQNTFQAKVRNRWFALFELTNHNTNPSIATHILVL